MKSINELQDELIEEFAYLDDWMDKYQVIIEMGNELPPFPEKYKTPEHIIEGCQSRVWIKGVKEVDDRLEILADSDAIIVKGIIAMLVKVLSGQTLTEIAKADLYFIDKIGLKEHLSPTRSNGLLAMIRHIKLLASSSL